MDRPIFVHIPKTGGSTMGPIVTRNYDRSRVLSVGRDHESAVRAFVALPQDERNRYQVVAGHVRYGIHRFFTEGTPRYFTMLRHPIERTLSAYSYALEKPRKPHHVRISEITFIEYVSDAKLGEKQAAWLMGYLPGDTPTLDAYGGDQMLPENTLDVLKKRLTEDFVLAGVLERYDASLLLLQDTFGWANMYYERMNTTGKRVRYGDLTAEEKRALDALTGKDFELYDWARAQFEAKIEALGEPFQKRLKAFQTLNATYVDRRRQFASLRKRFRPKHLVKTAMQRLLDTRDK
jgi:hypothetical protein